jgi:flagellar assembly protein FliH
MLDFALATCERIMPELLRTRSADRAAAEVRRCLSIAMGSPRIRIFLSRPVLDLHGKGIEEAILGRHAGTVVELAADPALAPGDARVEWDNGVMEYSFGRIAEQVLDALRRTRPLPADGLADGRLAHG